MSDADSLITTLRERFGIAAFRGLQEPVVRAVLDGNRALAVFPTGGGKSLCFQLPAVALGGVTVVISPLIALMADQVAKLQALGIAAERLDSTLVDAEARRIMDSVAAGHVRLLYVSPERFRGTGFARDLRKAPVCLVAVDEAHCVSEWGHNFRPEYLKIAALCRRMRVPRVLALTATATPAVARDLRREFRIATGHVYQAPSRRDNLALCVRACQPCEKDARLLAVLAETEGPAIVYATTRMDTERLTALLQKAGFSARAYHGGCDRADRAAAQGAFMRGDVRVMVATIAFGMGIDKPDIRTIIHYHLPKSLEGYSQETGRAGRDGLPARCELLAATADTLASANFIHGATPAPHAVRNLLDRVLRLAAPGGTFSVSTRDLSVSLDMREETVGTLLAHLELAGILEQAGLYHELLRVSLVRGMDDMLSGRPAAERRRVSVLFAAARLERGEYHFPLAAISAATGMGRDAIQKMLSALADAGDVRIVRRDSRVIYRLSAAWDGRIGSLSDDLVARFARRAEFEHGRIGQVLEFARSKVCRAVFLDQYFGGKNTAPCGLCDRCQGLPPVKLPPLPAAEPGAGDWEMVGELRALRHGALASPAQLARFLCGIPSPAALRARLHTREEFGLWRHLPYETVLGWMQA